LKSANARHALADMREQSGLGGDIFERAVSFVSIEPVWQSLKTLGSVNLHASFIAA
jgi:hypothetical protein